MTLSLDVVPEAVDFVIPFKRKLLAGVEVLVVRSPAGHVVRSRERGRGGHAALVGRARLIHQVARHLLFIHLLLGLRCGRDVRRDPV